MKHQDAIPQVLGDFRIIRRVGCGSLGSVYLASQQSRQQDVALKIIASRHGLSSKGVRHVQEFVTGVSKLVHPHIVPVYETGELGLLVYYTMEFIEGPSLDQVIARMKFHQATMYLDKPVSLSGDRPAAKCPTWVLDKFCVAKPGIGSVETLSEPKSTKATTAKNSPFHNFQAIALAISEVADGLECAHNAGILHHDIKPTNLLLSADGRLQIADFGLARLIEQPGMTLSSEYLGEATYMAPELLSAVANHLDHRADIYSLGVVLYEWITFELPFEGRSRPLSLTNSLLVDPRQPRQIDQRIPRDLQTICMKALREEPDKRYQTAQAFADDLRRFTNKQAIQARPVSVISKQVKWHKQNWSISASTLVASLIIAGAIGLSYRNYNIELAESNRYLNDSINDASVIAYAGNPQETLAWIQAVEGLGAESWVANMLNGQLALFSGQPARAAEELRQGLESNRKCIEMRVLLAKSFRELGRREELVKLERDLLRSVPTTPREKLFLGAWLSEIDLPRGYAIVKPVFDEMPWSNELASLEFADTLRLRAQDTGDVAACEEAIRLAYSISRSCPTNSYARAMEFKAALVAYMVLRDSDRAVTVESWNDANSLYATTMDADALYKKALTFLDELDKEFPNAQSTALAWAWRGCCADTSDDRLLAFRKSLSQLEQRQVSVPSILQHAYPLEIYLADELPATLQEIDTRRAAGDTDIAFLLALCLASGPDGISAAQAAIDSLADPVPGIAMIHQPTGLQLLGKPTEARRLYERIRNSKQTPAYRDGWLQRLVRYGCDEIDESALLAAMDQPAVSYFKRSEGHFFIGMKLLSQGDRQRAEEHFRQCMQARIFTAREYHISRMILAKLKSDSGWPSWISEST